MKKGKRAFSEASPSPFSVGEEDFGARKEHQILKQGYEDLLKDTEAKTIRLQMAKEMRIRLLAEVRFLRKKHEQFIQDSPHGTPYRLKKKQLRKASGSPPQYTNPPPQNYALARSVNNGVKGAMKHKPSVVLDLNRAFTLNGEEEMEQSPFDSEIARMEKLNRCSVDKAGIDMKISTVGAVAASSKRVGKRKVSWQDQVALRV